MGFTEDILDGGVRGKFYIDSRKEDTICRVDSVDRVKQNEPWVGSDASPTLKTMVSGLFYDFEGNRKGTYLKNITNFFGEDDAPMGFEPLSVPVKTIPPMSPERRAEVRERASRSVANMVPWVDPLATPKNEGYFPVE